MVPTHSPPTHDQSIATTFSATVSTANFLLLSDTTAIGIEPFGGDRTAAIQREKSTTVDHLTNSVLKTAMTVMEFNKWKD